MRLELSRAGSGYERAQCRSDLSSSRPALALATALAGCTTGGLFTSIADYGSRTDAGYSRAGHSDRKGAGQFRRQVVSYDTSRKAWHHHRRYAEKFLYFVKADGQAMRYGIGVGREGFEWRGTARIALKREWPVWTPPPAMIRRQPELAKLRGGMEPGPKNALGARAMYLFNKGGDFGYRLHGTPEWWSIGKAMSSGCIRLMNQDIIDLYDRTESAPRSSSDRGTVSATRTSHNRKPGLEPGFLLFWASAGRGSSGDLLDLLHFGNEMAEQVLDAVLQRRRRGRAAGAGALHVQEHGAVLVAAEGDVAAVLGNRRAHPGVEQFLDGDHDLGSALS